MKANLKHVSWSDTPNFCNIHVGEVLELDFCKETVLNFKLHNELLYTLKKFDGRFIEMMSNGTKLCQNLYSINFKNQG